ncbi:hypothetical protein ACFXTN_030278 [Malus domestica]
MPFSELYRMAGRVDSSQDFENDFLELVWENGQVVMQGQSSRTRKNPSCNTLPSYNTPKNRDRDVGNSNIGKTGKFGFVVDSELDEIPLSVPSSEMGLSEDDDMLPWLNYSIDEPLHHEYCHDFLPEFSSATANEASSNHNLASIDKRSSSSQVLRNSNPNSAHEDACLQQRNVGKVAISGRADVSRPRTGTSQLYSLSSQQSQAAYPSFRSRVSDTAGDNTSATHRDVGKNSNQISSTGGFPGMKMQRQDPVMPRNTNPSIMNFTHFSRPAALAKANVQNNGAMAGSGSSSMERIENKDKFSAATRNNLPESTLIDSSSGAPKESNSQCQPILVRSSDELKATKAKPLEEPCTAKRSEGACQEETSKNDINANDKPCESASRVSPGREKTLEPVVASSVCSGNSVERGSDDPTHALKRKCRETDESECHSDDVEDESVGVKKGAHARGKGSKRSRAAEVHNLSERRRRDRINEKMRALQELIPNSNKTEIFIMTYKVDKASMLDEAIEYLKTLQLQVQIMSMGAGMYMPPMMLSPGMQHMHGPRMAHFSPMGVGMGMGLGMGFGMGMPDMNGASSSYPILQVPPMQGAHFPGSHMAGHNAFNGMMGSNLQMFGLPSQGVPMQMQRAPLAPSSGGPLVKSSAGPNAGSSGGPVENVESAPVSGSKDWVQNMNSQVMQNNNANSSINPTSSQGQATNEGFGQTALVRNNVQAADANNNRANR